MTLPVGEALVQRGGGRAVALVPPREESDLGVDVAVGTVLHVNGEERAHGRHFQIGGLLNDDGEESRSGEDVVFRSGEGRVAMRNDERRSHLNVRNVDLACFIRGSQRLKGSRSGNRGCGAL